MDSIKLTKLGALKVQIVDPLLTQHVINIAKEFQFTELLNIYSDQCHSINAPYHNQYHTNCMISNCAEGARYFFMPPSDTRIVTIAALFHDFDHASDNSCADAINIAVAVDAFKKYAKNSNITKYEFHEIINTIKITEYPFVKDPVTIFERIIRDADMLQITHPLWYLHVIKGLQKELSIARELVMLQGEVDFLRSVRLFTTWGEQRFNKVYEMRIAEMELRIQLYNQVLHVDDNKDVVSPNWPIKIVVSD